MTDETKAPEVTGAINDDPTLAKVQISDKADTPIVNESFNKQDAAIESMLDRIAAKKAEREKANADASPPKTTEVAPAQYEFGNKAIEVAVNAFCKSTGATEQDIDRATSKAIEYGDPNLIDVQFLKERFGADADSAIELTKAVIEYSATETERLIQDVYNSAGGKEAWAQSVSLFNSVAPKSMVNVIRTMLDSGDVNSIREASKAIVDFASNSGAMVAKSGTRIQAGGGISNSQGLSAEEFREERGKLNPNSRNYEEQYYSLMERRKLGKQLGK